jgi:hypothetical protein
MEKEMVEAARTNFEENLARPAVPALTEAKWLARVALPLGMSEEGDLFYGSSPDGSERHNDLHLTHAGKEEARKILSR